MITQVKRADSRCTCPECEKPKSVFVPDPRDHTQKQLICLQCSMGIEYAVSEMQSGLATQREELLNV